MGQERDFYLYTLNEKGGYRCFASPVAEDLIFEKGLPNEAIAGEFIEGSEHTTAEHFKQNPVFLKFLHWAIAKHIRNCPGFTAQAEEKQNGQVMIVDTRGLPSDKEIPKEDTLAAVEIKDGKAVKFQGLKAYKVFTEQGFMRIDPWLHDKVVEELKSLIEANRSSKAQ